MFIHRNRCSKTTLFLLCCTTYNVRLLGKVLVEGCDGLNSAIEVLQAEALVRRVDSIAREAKAEQDRLHTECLLEVAHNGNTTARVEG